VSGDEINGGTVQLARAYSARPTIRKRPMHSAGQGNSSWYASEFRSARKRFGGAPARSRTLRFKALVATGGGKMAARLLARNSLREGKPKTDSPWNARLMSSEGLTQREGSQAPDLAPGSLQRLWGQDDSGGARGERARAETGKQPTSRCPPCVAGGIRRSVLRVQHSFFCASRSRGGGMQPGAMEEEKVAQ